MELRQVHTNAAPRRIGPYTQAIVFQDLVFTSGQLALDPHTGQRVAGDVYEQTRVALQNIGRILEAAGSGLDQVIKTTVFVADLGSFEDMNRAYREIFESASGTLPARATVGATLFPGFHVEIDAVAALRS